MWFITQVLLLGEILAGYVRRPARRGRGKPLAQSASDAISGGGLLRRLRSGMPASIRQSPIATINRVISRPGSRAATGIRRPVSSPHHIVQRFAQRMVRKAQQKRMRCDNTDPSLLRPHDRRPADPLPGDQLVRLRPTDPQLRRLRGPDRHPGRWRHTAAASCPTS